MSWTPGTFPILIQAAEVEYLCIIISTGGVDVLHTWREEDGSSDGLDECAVLIQDAGVGLEVGLIVELGRVDEVGYHYGVTFGDGPADE